MAHKICFNENTNQHSFFSVKEKAWHGLGQIVEDYPTLAEAIKFAGLASISCKAHIESDMIQMSVIRSCRKLSANKTEDFDVIADDPTPHF